MRYYMKVAALNVKWLGCKVNHVGVGIVNTSESKKILIRW